MSASLESTRSESVRQAFLNFFAEKQHEIVRSASLVPHDDPTLMFTNAGMNQFKDVFLATGSRPYLRAADTQKCLRVSGKHNDLEEVGVDTYHHTLFEMLGNWSFGDYFKREAIAWAWELLVDRWGLDPQRLYVTVHEGDEALGLEPDDEAANLWRTETTVPHDHILYADSKDNFWSMGDTGPCGPCSEIHVDLRSDEERAQVPGKQLVNADDPRVIEIWNLVFIQYNALGDGRLEPLAAQHVDTGMGFERIVAVLQGSSSTYDTDLFAPIFARLAELSPRGDVKGYDDLHINDEAERERVRIAMRVVADHIRAVSFAIADGAMPSNEGRGYVIRRILRRAVRYGYQSLGFTEPFLYELFEPLRDKMAGSFPELDEQAGLIVRVIKAEEEGFLRTLETGLKLFDEQVAQAGSDTLSGDAAFLLHDTYGFPVDLTELMAREQGLSVDKDRYDELMQEQKDRARAATAFKSGQNVAGEDTANQLSDTEFVGYEHVQDTGAKIIDARAIEPASEGEPFTYQLVLDRTPFYAESGGQVGDTGTLTVAGETIQVLGTQKRDGVFFHIVDKLPAQPDGPVVATVDVPRRDAIRRHHTATHLLHKVLRDQLGTHVAQKGSLVAPDRLRFDFSHFERVTSEELRSIEAAVNHEIQANVPADVMTGVTLDEAKAMGAMMLFGEKYGDTVRVVKFGNSVELCGGTHVGATGEIGLFRFVNEESVAAGIRRVEALVGEAALQHVQDRLEELDRVRAQFAGLSGPADEAVADTLASLKAADKEITRLKQANLAGNLDQFIADAENVDGIRLVTGRLDGADMDALRTLGQELRGRLGESSVAVLGSADPDAGKVYLVATVSDDLIARGIKAGTLVGQLAKHVGGGGGGRPQLATAGGRQPEKLDEALRAASGVLT